jgi:hypothetical protein
MLENGSNNIRKFSSYNIIKGEEKASIQHYLNCGT